MRKIFLFLLLLVPLHARSQAVEVVNPPSDPVNVTCNNCGGAGTTTPSDAFPNPTNAVTTFSLLGGWNGATWDRFRSTTARGLQNDMLGWGGTALGAPANFGASPGAVIAGSVNAGCFVVTTACVAATAGVQLVGIEGRAGTSFETTAGILDHNNARWANTALGTPTNFGTTPTAVIAGSVNASMFSGTTALGTPNTFGTTAPTGNALGVNASLFIGTTLAGNVAAGVQRVGIAGSVNAALDAVRGAAPPANALAIAWLGSGATGGFMLMIPVCDSFANINIVTATTTLAVTGVGGRHVRICSLSMLTAGADNVAFISGTGATCGTGTTAMSGGVTSATGYNFAANQGITQGGGIGTINQTNATGDSVCIITSAAVQLSGRIAYTIY